MAKMVKKHSSKQGWFSKGVNIGLWVLAFSRVITIAFTGTGNIGDKLSAIQKEATFGLSEGSFDLAAGLQMYSPAGAAVGLNELKKYAMVHFPVRG